MSEHPDLQRRRFLDHIEVLREQLERAEAEKAVLHARLIAQGKQIIEVPKVRIVTKYITRTRVVTKPKEEPVFTEAELRLMEAGDEAIEEERAEAVRRNLEAAWRAKSQTSIRVPGKGIGKLRFQEAMALVYAGKQTGEIAKAADVHSSSVTRWCQVNGLEYVQRWLPAGACGSLESQENVKRDVIVADGRDDGEVTPGMAVG